MSRRAVSFVAVLAVLLSLTTMASAAAPTEPENTGYAVVELKSPAAAVYEGGIPGLERTKPANGRLNPDRPAYQAYLRHLVAGPATPPRGTTPATSPSTAEEPR